MNFHILAKKNFGPGIAYNNFTTVRSPASLRSRKCYWFLCTMNPPALTADVICEWPISYFLAYFANESKKYQKSEFHGLIIY